MKKAFVAILSLAALVACSQDSVVKTPESTAISFDNMFVENKTRAAADPSTTTANINEFAVWGFRGDAQELVFNNERVYKEGDVWTYDHLQYWMEGKDYFFGAVSPVNHKDVTVDTQAMSKDGLGTISFTNTDGSVDLIYAEKVVYASEINPSAPEKVKLQFAHLLSRVKFSFKYNFPNELTTVAVKNIKINNSPANGSIDVTEARADWSWNIPQNGATMLVDFGHVENGNEFAAMDTYYESDKYRLIIPTDETRNHDITFDVVVYNNHVEAETYSISTTLKDKAFVQGKSYNIVTEITPDNIVDGGLKPIEFDVIEVEDWVDENDEPIYPEDPEQPVDPENPNPENPFEAVASEWGVVGDLTNWGGSSDIVMYTTPTENLFVAEKVEIKSGAFKIRANKQWNDAKNYGFEAAGKAYADKYYAVITGSGSQNMTPIEYGVYDVYFDLAQKRVALMTPGKAYAEAEDGGDPVVVVEGLKDHAWGLIGSFAGSDWANDVVMTVDGDWAVAKNVTIAKNNEFKFRADKAWALSYGSACDVVADKTYNTYNNGGNMKFIGETGAYDIYFSLVSAKFYMTVAGAEAPAEPEALATPVVEASVEGNVVTLTWAAVENAAQYSITVGTEMPVFVEETTYVFTGEYETEYTFNVVAVPEDEEKFAASEAATAKATTEAEPAEEVVYTTVAEFLALTDVVPSDATPDQIAAAPLYTLKGTITSVTNTSYGNFYLNDGTGEVLIYGLVGPNGEQKYWATSGAKVGDDITVKTIRTEYGNSPQGKNATFVEVNTPGTFAFWLFDATAASFGAEGGEKTIDVAIYNTDAEVKAVSDNAQFSATYADGVLTVTAEENTTSEAINGNITVTCGDWSQVVTVSQAGAGSKQSAEASLSFANKAQRTSFSGTAQVWEQNGIKFTNEKSSSTNAVADYANPVRLYQNSRIIVEAPGEITAIVFDCNSSSYATALKNSIGSTATVSVSSDKVTVTLDGSSSKFTVEKLSAQVRMDAVTVTYLE